MSFLNKLKKDIGVEKNSEKVTKPIKIEGEKPKKRGRVEKKQMKKEKEDVLATKKTTQSWSKSEGELTVDVYNTDSEFCVQAPIAGVTPEDIEITIENEMLLIKGERKKPEANKEKDYFYQECYWGPFSRQIILPENIDTQRVKSSLEKGILTIKIPRAKKTKKKKVSITSND